MVISAMPAVKSVGVRKDLSLGALGDPELVVEVAYYHIR